MGAAAGGGDPRFTAKRYQQVLEEMQQPAQAKIAGLIYGEDAGG